MFNFSRSRFGRAGRFAASAGLCLTLLFTAVARGQSETTAKTAVNETARAGHGRILLVLPFENHTGQLSLDWMREAASELLNSRFSSAGFAPLSREDRVYAFDHLGLPQGFDPSRASAIRLAQTLDANEIVVGSFRKDGKDLVAEAQLVDVPHLRMTKPVTSRGKMVDMIAIFDSLAWKLTKELDPNFSVAEKTFVAAGAGLRLDAFEQYIRGISGPEQSERLEHLEAAVKLSPNLSPAWMALGREEYDTEEYGKAAAAFAKVDHSGPDGLEADFYRGLSLLFSGKYAGAEKSFAAVARVLPLAEVLNNEGVAVSRQGHDATSLFVRAAAADPNTADYHFNLAVSLKHHGNATAAISQMAECLKLHPGDSEAQSVLAAWKAQSSHAGGSSAATPSGPKPLERIVRTFDATAFRQAAAVLNKVDAARLAALPAQERAEKLCTEAKGYLDRGLVLEAERLYQSALVADKNLAEAHAGLAEVRLRTGDMEAASKQANEALKLDPSADAYMVLSRVDLAGGKLAEAADNNSQALKLDPGSQAAQQLQKQIEARKSQKKKE